MRAMANLFQNVGSMSQPAERRSSPIRALAAQSEDGIRPIRPKKLWSSGVPAPRYARVPTPKKCINAISIPV